MSEITKIYITAYW